MLDRRHQDGSHTGRLKKSCLTWFTRSCLAAFDIQPGHFFRVFVCLYDTESLHPLSMPITPAMYRLGDRAPILHPSIRLGVQGLAQIVCERQRAFHDAVVQVHSTLQSKQQHKQIGYARIPCDVFHLVLVPARIRDEHHGGRNCHAIGLIRFLFRERFQRCLPRRATVR